MLQEDYLKLVKQIGSKEAITRRFFIIFEYEPWAGARRGNEEAEAISALQTATRTAENYLHQCGNKVISPDNEDEFAVEVLYNLLCRSQSVVVPIAERAQAVVAKYVAAGKDVDRISVSEFFSPDSTDFYHGRFIPNDGGS